MSKRLCRRCGNEIKLEDGYIDVLTVDTLGVNHDTNDNEPSEYISHGTFELCEACSKSFTNWLVEKKKGIINESR